MKEMKITTSYKISSVNYIKLSLITPAILNFDIIKIYRKKNNEYYFVGISLFNEIFYDYISDDLLITQYKNSNIDFQLNYDNLYI
jgi:hypothetical protein